MLLNYCAKLHNKFLFGSIQYCGKRISRLDIESVLNLGPRFVFPIFHFQHVTLTLIQHFEGSVQGIYRILIFGLDSRIASICVNNIRKIAVRR